ncbi:hypothetical protein [Bacteroides sp. 51]|uniref:hypothetical protein n=1 Tax=Bacteroides sp. 51 TaxID=2302938 RepID=UPI0013D7E3CE|nr:hypothetical protein [Bacteroides sp. 51]NDV83949.1 hypothetical protein [Bacteroides sp. 51]
MDEQEKREWLKNISMQILQAKENLKMLSFLSNEKNIQNNKEVDYWLDRLRNLENLERELKKK